MSRKYLKNVFRTVEDQKLASLKFINLLVNSEINDISLEDQLKIFLKKNQNM